MTATSGAGRTSEATGERGTRATWHWWGVGAGVLGLVAHLISDPHASLTTAERGTGDAVTELVDRGAYHVGAVTGFLAVACLLALAAGYRRWSEGSARDTIAARMVPSSLIASAGAMIVGYGVKGMMAVYLPGGINENEYPAEGLYSMFLMNDLLPFLAWWGVAVAAAAVAWLGLRERLVPRWIGIVSALAALVPLLFVVLTGLTGFAGVITPLWLIVISVGLALRRPIG